MSDETELAKLKADAQMAKYQQAMQWEQHRSMALQNAYMQQQNDLARLQQMQNALAGLGGAYLGGLGSMTGMSMATTGAMYAATTAASYSSLHPSGTTGGRSERAREVVQKTWDEPAKAEEPFKLTLKNSPLFGEPAFGRWYRWRFDSPFAPIRKRFERWAMKTHRRMA